jgi:hypothetical protein
VQDTIEENLGATECERNVEVRWNNIKKCVMDTMSDLIGKSKQERKKAVDFTGNDQ